MCNIQLSNILINILTLNSIIWPKAYIYVHCTYINLKVTNLLNSVLMISLDFSLIPTKHLCILVLAPLRHLICTNFLQLCRNRGVSSLGAFAPDESNQGGICPLLSVCP